MQVYCRDASWLKVGTGQDRHKAKNKGQELDVCHCCHKLTHMEKTQVYLRKEELAALREAAARSGRSVAEVVRDAIRKGVLKPHAAGPVAIWDGEPKRTSIDHDSVHDEP